MFRPTRNVGDNRVETGVTRTTEEPFSVSGLKKTTEKNLMVFSGRAHPQLAEEVVEQLGTGTNIGAGTIFANYDGVEKHRTVVGRHARTGSNNTFVAPVEIGDGAGTGGGTVVRRDVPPGALAVSGGPQRNLVGWAARRRAGTKQADAAQAADPAAGTDEGARES